VMPSAYLEVDQMGGISEEVGGRHDQGYSDRICDAGPATLLACTSHSAQTFITGRGARRCGHRRRPPPALAEVMGSPQQHTNPEEGYAYPLHCLHFHASSAARPEFAILRSHRSHPRAQP